jgi:CO/xanthine dehydrogenase Mo-binding subunit
MEIVDTNRGKMYVSGQHCPFNWDSGTMAIYLIAEKLGMDPTEVARVNLHAPRPERRRARPQLRGMPRRGRQTHELELASVPGEKLPDGRMHGIASGTRCARGMPSPAMK